MFDVPEDPGIADGATADHDAIHPVLIAVGFGFFRTIDVAIAKNGDLDVRVLFDFLDVGPISGAFVLLFACPAGDDQCFDARVL